MAGVATGQVVSFTIGASVEQTSNLFTHIEVYRSRSGEFGPYEEITGPEWGPAQFRVPAKNLLLSGKVASFRVGETTDISISFSGSNPLSPVTIATQIQAQGLGLISSYIDGTDLLIESRQPGAAATLRALDSDGTALLGLPLVEPDSVAFGHDARIPIVAGKEDYDFSDPHGQKDYFYKVRFFNPGLNSVSDFSEPFTIGGTSPVDENLLVSGFLQLIDIGGLPMEGTDVRVHMKSQSTLLGDTYLVGESNISKVTDAEGLAEFTLPRGVEIAVVVVGTNISRDVVTPTDPSVKSFNLLDPAYGSDDAFKVQRPQFDYAVRRAL